MDTRSEGSARATRADIQGLRAVAVLLVIGGHAGVPGLRGGYVGVDVFFVVSGFLISTLLLREAGRTGRISLAGFYARRARRILPAATVVLVALAVFAALRLPPTEVGRVGDDVLWAAFFLANVHLARSSVDYFAIDQAPSAVQHYWSLAVEEQFYLVWPAVLLLLLTVHRSRDRRPPTERAAARRGLVVGVVGAVLAASLVWSVVATQSSPASAYFSSLTRAWELAAGVLLSTVAGPLGRLPRPVRHLLSAAGLSAIAVAATTYTEATPFPGWHALLPVLGTAAVLAAGCGLVAPGGPAAFLSLRPLTWVGDTSYSLYLWHWPLLVLGPAYVGGLHPALGNGLLVVLTFAAATASYYLVENPVRHSRSVLRGHARPLLLWPVALSLVMASTVWSTHHAEDVVAQRQATFVDLPGVPTGSARPLGQGAGGARPAALAAVRDRIDDAVLRAERHAPIPFPLVNLDHLGRDIFLAGWDCLPGWTESRTEICPIGDEGSATTVVALGDSFLAQWLPAIDRIGAREHLRVVPLIKYGCAPFDVHQQHHSDTEFASCPAFRTWSRRQVARLHPDLLVLGYRGLLDTTPDPGRSLEETWSAGVRSALAELARVVPPERTEILSSISVLPFEPLDCVTAPGADMATCTADEGGKEVDANPLTRREAHLAGVRYVDAGPLVCRRHRCPAVVDRTLVRHDGGHITRTWSLQTVDALAELLDLRRLATSPG